MAEEMQEAQEMDYLIEEFIERYLSRAEIIHRLPVSRPISSFWPALQEARRARD